MNWMKRLLPLLLGAALTLTACGGGNTPMGQSGDAVTLPATSEARPVVTDPEDETPTGTDTTVALDDIPAYTGDAYVAVNDNQPYFTESDYTTEAFETYSDLDALGRCGAAYANICVELMPTEERGEIGQVKPTGWHSTKYDCVDGKYLYNRCHLIGFQLAGENANEKNLITGTRYLNIQGMLPFENLVTDYVKETEHHVLYRVTPIFTDDDLVADGVLMEGWSVEDGGEGVCFCVFAYNVQPGVTIDYATGDSALAEETVADSSSDSSGGMEYVLNTSSMKFHLPSCSSVDTIDPANREDYTGTRDEVIAMGYAPCGRCKP